MTHHDYTQSREIAGHTMATYIMAAIRCAPDSEIVVLRAAFPDIYSELEARYHSPGGHLPTDNAPPEPLLWDQTVTKT